MSNKPFRKLSELFRNVGEPWSFGDVEPQSWLRFVRSPFGEVITEDTITEPVFVRIVEKIFSESYPELWIRRNVNLWEIPDVKRIVEVNPLQPDIDLLYCENQKLPLVGVEVKLFSKYTGWEKLTVPKSSRWEGYYSGFDQALAILNFGLDYVYLLHVFVVQSEKINELIFKKGDVLTEKVLDKLFKRQTNYWATIFGLVVTLRLPIGYIPIFLNSVGAREGEESGFEVACFEPFDRETTLGHAFLNELTPRENPLLHTDIEGNVQFVREAQAIRKGIIEFYKIKT